MNSTLITPVEIFDLPQEIILLIAKQLDVVSLIVFSSASKFTRQLLSVNDLWRPHFFEAFNSSPCLQDCFDFQKKPETFYRNSFFRKKGISNISDSVISPNTENPYFNIQVFGKNAFQLFHRWNQNKHKIPELDLNYSAMSYQKNLQTSTFSITVDFSEPIRRMIPDFPLKNLTFLSHFKDQAEKDVFDFFELNLFKPSFTLPIKIINAKDFSSLNHSLKSLGAYRLSYFLIDFSDQEDLQFASKAMEDFFQNTSVSTPFQRESFYLIGIHNAKESNLTHQKQIVQLTEKLKINFISIDLSDPKSIHPTEHISEILVQTLKTMYTPSDFSQIIPENESELNHPQIRQ